MKRLLCWLGFHRTVEMERLILLRTGWVTLEQRWKLVQWSWTALGVIRCAWCGAELEDGQGYTTTSWRTIGRG
jgi:hypothetical protein